MDRRRRDRDDRVLLVFGRDYRKVESYKYVCGVAAVVLLAAAAGDRPSVNGARLWVDIGPLGFQPGELAKVFLIVFLAAYLREKREVLAQARLGFDAALSSARRCSSSSRRTTSAARSSTSGSSWPCSTWPPGARSSSPSASRCSQGAALAYTSIGRVGVRIDTWLDPWADLHGAGYQPAQALYSIGNGFGGTGLGRGTFTSPEGRTSPTSTRTSSSPRSPRSSASSASPPSCSSSWCSACAASAQRSSPRTASRSCSPSASRSASRCRRSSSSAACCR